MRFRRVQDALESFADEAQRTLPVIAAALQLNPEQRLPRGRSPQALCEHLVLSPGRILAFTPLDREDRLPREPADLQGEDLLGAYGRMAKTLRELLADGVGDRDLEETDRVYDRVWTRGETLAIVLMHEIHHRGQLCGALRALGARVPAVYGPSADD